MKKNLIKKMAIWTLIAGLTFDTVPVWALSKNETIYAKLNEDGSNNEVIVSEHLNDKSNSFIKDKSSLENIKNVNGEEKYNKQNNEMIWEAKGNDIYYQGTTTKKLPINLNIKYYLDGKEQKVDDIIGKSGKVKIVLKYQNNEKHTAIVNGKKEELYTPFVVALTTVVSNSSNKNIEVTNGKIIDNGTNSVVVALATPGLYESLDIDKLKGMDTITISFDSEYFELGSIYSVATNKLVEKSDLDIFNNIDKLYDNINKLSNSSASLVKGSEDLLNGAMKLKNGTTDLKNGINTAYKGSKTIIDTVNASIDNLRKDNSPALDDETLNLIVQQASQSAKLTEEQKNAIGNQALNSIKNSDSYKQIENQYNNYVELAAQAENASKQYENAGLLDEANEYKIKVENAKTAATTYKTMLTIMEQTAIQTSIQTASSVSTNVAEAVSKEVATSVATNAKNTAKNQTINSLTTLVNGLSELQSGLAKLNDGASILYDGTDSLINGVTLLSEGTKKFNKEGINKIVTLVNGNVKTIEEKIKVLNKLSEDYKTLDDIHQEADGSSKIIMVIDAIKKEKEEKVNEEKVVLEDKSLWQKIKGLFTK